MNAIDPVRVALFGCGLIGTDWDDPQSSHAYALTHASAFSRTPGSQIVAMCDIDQDKAENAAKRWGCPRAYSDPAALFSQNKIDLAVIATSSAARWSVIQPALTAGVRYFVIEKPLASSLAESATLVAALDAAGARTVVNYSRRWDPSMKLLKEQMAAGMLGAIQRFVGTYGKGISNNGSHMIDLVAALSGSRPATVRTLGSPLPSTENSWSTLGERTFDAQIRFSNDAGGEFQLDMLGTDQAAFTCFELRILGTEAVCDIRLGGRQISISRTAADPIYPNYKILGDAVSQPSRALESMSAMAAEAVELASGKILKSSCDVHVALETAAAVDAIAGASDQQDRWIDVRLSGNP